MLATAVAGSDDVLGLPPGSLMPSASTREAMAGVLAHKGVQNLGLFMLRDGYIEKPLLKMIIVDSCTLLNCLPIFLLLDS